MKCKRCNTKTDITTMSMFNTDIICMGCKAIERNDPAYKAATEAERREVLAGNYDTSLERNTQIG